MSNIKKLTLAGILVAMGVVTSAFYIPIGVAKCFPIQSLINVLAGVLLGPLYAVCMAFVTSLMRVMMGTGTLLAFPGSMCGALLCGVLYKYTKNPAIAFVGEVFGTGIIGAILAFPIATLFLSKTAALFGFVIPFGLSSLVGAAISLVFLRALKKTGILKILNMEAKNNGI
jgi:energy coupling factor transporter S component ThiW